MECPLCFKEFTNEQIVSHAEKCQGLKTRNRTSQQTADKINAKSKPSSATTWPAAFKLKRRNTNDVPECQMKSLKRTQSSEIELKPSKEKLQSEASNAACDAKCEASAIKSKLNIPKAMKSSSNSMSFIKPFAQIARPTEFSSFLGQDHVMGSDTTLRKILATGNVPSMILWGPPGCGKTTLAHIVANTIKNKGKESNGRVVKLSATESGKAEVISCIKAASNHRAMFKSSTVLIVDEIHCFNKLQQDTFLPHLENGNIILIGATTENPSFSLNSALLSRCQVVVLEKLDESNIQSIICQAIKSHLPQCRIENNIMDNGDGKENTEMSEKGNVCIQGDAIAALSNLCNGDARTALNCLSLAVMTCQSELSVKNPVVSEELIRTCLQRTNVLYDKKGDQHYEMASAFQKSIRGCDSNAALYWLARMLAGGEDPKFIARRLIRTASEDIGLADPQALNQAVSAYHSVINIGMPECDVVLAQCTIYLARAPKSTEVYHALASARKNIAQHEGPLPGVPLHLRNASTELTKKLGYGQGYKRQSNAENVSFLPEQLKDINFFA